MTLTLFLEQLVNGIILGSMYAIMGAGLALIYGTMRILNFAHGEFYMLGGFFVFFLFAQQGLHPVAAVAIAVAGVALIAAVVQRLTVSVLLKREGWAFSTIAATLGVSIFLQNLALALWGERFQSVPYFVEGLLQVGDFRLPWQRVLIFAVAVAVMAVMAYVLRYTRFGWAVRATAQDPEAAAVVGVPAARIHTMTFALGAALAAVAAALLAPVFAVNPWMGLPLIIKAFVVVVLGGLGSFPGAIAGGFLLGIVEAVGITLTSSEWRDVIAFGMMIAFLWVRPWGLFGVKER
ncbi:branched-chain amino acid ABC transporter permease [Stella sp.]|uniref:branched-chain amino acid ABC transporter permease n=1 Tax=Stella sp. TaxID=2912054 RepID=UPI0035B23C0A